MRVGCELKRQALAVLQHGSFKPRRIHEICPSKWRCSSGNMGSMALASCKRQSAPAQDIVGFGGLCS